MAPAPPPRSAALLLLGALLALDLVVAVLPFWALRDGQPMTDVATLALSVVPLLAYAALLARIGRTDRRRAVAAGVVLALVQVHLAFWFVVRDARAGELAGDDLGVLETAAGVLLGTGLVAAWCIARRTTRWWLPCLVLVPVLLLAQASRDESMARRFADVAGHLDDPGGSYALLGALWWAWSTAPLLAVGLVCWVPDSLVRRERART